MLATFCKYWLLMLMLCAHKRGLGKGKTGCRLRESIVSVSCDASGQLDGLAIVLVVH